MRSCCSIFHVVATSQLRSFSMNIVLTVATTLILHFIYSRFDAFDFICSIRTRLSSVRPSLSLFLLLFPRPFPPSFPLSPASLLCSFFPPPRFLVPFLVFPAGFLAAWCALFSCLCRAASGRLCKGAPLYMGACWFCLPFLPALCGF